MSWSLLYYQCCWMLTNHQQIPFCAFQTALLHLCWLLHVVYSQNLYKTLLQGCKCFQHLRIWAEFDVGCLWRGLAKVYLETNLKTSIFFLCIRLSLTAYRTDGSINDAANNYHRSTSLASPTGHHLTIFFQCALVQKSKKWNNKTARHSWSANYCTEYGSRNLYNLSHIASLQHYLTNQCKLILL